LKTDIIAMELALLKLPKSEEVKFTLSLDPQLYNLSKSKWEVMRTNLHAVVVKLKSIMELLDSVLSNMKSVAVLRLALPKLELFLKNLELEMMKMKWEKVNLRKEYEQNAFGMQEVFKLMESFHVSFYIILK
jgi:hypothetical protein